MSTSTFDTGDGELVITVEMVDVTSFSPKPDKTWHYTDRQGHEHYWRDGYPTLTHVVDETYWSDDTGQEETDGHLECEQCGETIEPRTTLSMLGRLLPGRRSYTLDGEPISEERAQEIIARGRPDP